MNPVTHSHTHKRIYMATRLIIPPTPPQNQPLYDSVQFMCRHSMLYLRKMEKCGPHIMYTHTSPHMPVFLSRHAPPGAVMVVASRVHDNSSMQCKRICCSSCCTRCSYQT